MLKFKDAISLIPEINRKLMLDLKQEDFLNDELKSFFNIKIIENIIIYSFESYEGNCRLMIHRYNNINEYFFNDILSFLLHKNRANNRKVVV